MTRISDESSAQRPPSAISGARRKTAIQAAAEDRARLQLSLETANLFTWEIHGDIDTVVTSPNASAVLGFAPPVNIDEMLEMIHPNDREVVKAHFDLALHHGQKFDAEFRVVSPEQCGIVWVQAQGVLIDTEPTGSQRIVGISQNITDRKQRELNADFLVRLSDATRPLVDSATIQHVATQLLGEHLGASRVVYGGIRPDGTTVIGPHYVDGVEELPDQLRVASFDSTVLDQLGGRRTVVCEDVLTKPDLTPEQRAASEAISLRAHVDVPLVKDGRLVAALSVHQAQPRRWTDREIEIIEQTAERTWAVIVHAQTELELRESEERYRTLFNSIDEGFCVIEVMFDEDGYAADYRFVEANPAFERHTGLQGALDKTAREMVPKLEQHWFDLYGAVAATGEPIRFVEHAQEMGDRWFDVHAFRIGDPEARQVALLFSDISEAKRAEAALRASEERLRHAIEIETVGVIFFKTDGQITFANSAFLQMSGYSRDDVEAGKLRWDVMTPPEWMPRSLHAVDEFITHGRTTPYEKEYIRKNGSRWWALFAAARIDDDEGVEYVIDITRSKRAEVERGRLAAIVESSRDAVIGIDLDGIIMDWNPATTALYGYTAQEAVGQSIGMLMPPDRLHERSSILAKLRSHENIEPFETVRCRKDGTLVEVEVRPSPVLDAAGRVIGGAIIARDATARKRLERAQDDFLAMASHDLRSPVTVISGRAQIMKRRQTFDEAGIDTILEQANRLERLIADLQELVKIEAGGFELERQPVELGDMARQAAERARIQAPGRIIQVEGPPEAITGKWDPHRLGQVLDNLIGNAIKYSPDDGVVRVRAERRDGEGLLHISDAGPGIPAGAIPHLFDRFYRVDQNHSAAGLGLGLYIARMLVEAHGGRIWAESALGQGSTFTIALPLDA